MAKRSRTTWAQERTIDSDLEARLAAVEEAVGDDDGGGGGGTIPEPCVPTFAIAYERLKRGVRASFCATVAVGSEVLKTVIIRDADADTQAHFEQRRLGDGGIELDDAQSSSGHVEYRFQPRLEYDTPYGLVYLITKDSDGSNVLRNPPTDAVFSDPRLASFRTPEAFGVPSSPSLALIKQNILDPKTTKHDALVELWVWAPLTDVGAAQTWAASEVDKLIVAVRRTDVGSTGRIDIPPYDITAADTDVDPASTPVPNRGVIKLVIQGLRVGAPYEWARNTGKTNGDRIDSTGPAVAFTGANRTTNLATLTGVSLQLDNVEPFDDKFRFASLLLTQPATPVALKAVRVFSKIVGQPDSSYKTVVKKTDLMDDEWNSAGAKVIPLKEIKFKPSKSYTVRIRLTAIGGTDADFFMTVGTGIDPDVPGDTASPTGLGVPILAFSAKTGLHLDNLTVSTDYHTLTEKRVVITNGGAFFDLPTYLQSNQNTVQITSETNARKRIGPGKTEVRFGVRLDDLKTLFGSSGTIFAYFYATNDVGTSVASAFSTGLNLGLLRDNTNRKDAITKLSAGVVPPGRQLLRNADFLSLTGAVCDFWDRWNGITTPILATAPDVTTSSADINLRPTTHSLIFTTTSRILTTSLRRGRILPAQFYSFACQIRATTTLAGMELRLQIKRDDNALDNTENISSPFLNYIPILLTGLNTEFQEFGTLVKVLDFPSLDDGAVNINQILCLTLTGVLGGNQVELARPIFVRGQDPPKFEIREEDDDVFDVLLSGGVQANADESNVVGTDGGWFLRDISIGGPMTRFE